MESKDMNVSELAFGQDIIRARFPWLDVIDDGKHTDDAYFMELKRNKCREINMCLHCKKAECDNCMENPQTGRPPKADFTIFKSLLDKKVSVKGICDELGISRATFFEYKKKIKGENK